MTMEWISNKQFRFLNFKKLQDSKLNDTSELTKQRLAFKTLLSQTEQMMKKIWDELSQSIKQVYDWIEKENQSYFNIINENTNLAESSYTDLEKLVNIVEGSTLNDWNAQKNSLLKELDQTKSWWDQLIKAFIEKSKEGIRQIKQSIEKEVVYQMKEDLFEILTYIQDIDESLSIRRFLKYLEERKFQMSLNSFRITTIKTFMNLQATSNRISRMNIQDHKFNKYDYSQETNEKERLDLINRMKNNKGIIDFIRFLVLLTSIDGKFIQSGSNGLNLCVGMKVDIRNKSFENIRIKNTSLIGGYFVRCNLSGSEFENVDISGVNFNGAKLFYCKWKNLKINELNKLQGHNEPVSSVCFSPDGKTLASGGGSIIGDGDKSIRLWDVKIGQQKAKLEGHSSCINSICFSPDGNTLASGSSDNSIRLWDVKTGQQQAKLDGHCSCINSVCFSPDGNILASGSSDNSIRLWDVKTGQQQAKLEGHSDYVQSVCFFPDGNTLASGSDDESIRLWDVKTGQQKAKLDGHTGGILSVCLSPNGNTLASGSGDYSIRLWNVKTGQQKAKLDGHTNGILSVCLSPDGNTLASGSCDYSIRLWDVKTGKYTAKQDGHTNGILSVCFSPDGNTFASSLEGKSICLQDVKNVKELSSYDKIQKDILTSFQIPLQNSALLPNVNPDRTILRIYQNPLFETSSTLIFQGEFINHQGLDLKPLFKSKGSCFLEVLQQK
ncbi:unnamed protein product [Paramecium pentaurelia]|uniref:WD-40 repeat protein n=1 Tax=Paramecium pentaurelia TaxID=43138 RepID=A0A8S1Y779_9CILI|nr:unnamed protein product [Paramecium pentaurelia]